MQLHPAREQDLIEQSHHRPDAFRELYRHYFPRIYAYVTYRVGREQDAEDVTAGIFLKAVESLDRFEYRGQGSFAGWLFRIASNEVAQFYRDQGRAKDAVSLEDVPDIRSASPSPVDVIAQKEQFAHLHRLISELAPRQREVVTLRFFGHLRNHEIAAALQLKERTVAAYLCRALEELERKYQSELNEEVGS